MSLQLFLRKTPHGLAGLFSGEVKHLNSSLSRTHLAWTAEPLSQEDELLQVLWLCIKSLNKHSLSIYYVPIPILRTRGSEMNIIQTLPSKDFGLTTEAKAAHLHWG